MSVRVIMSVNWKGDGCNSEVYTVVVVAQRIKNLSSKQDMQVQSLGWEDPLEEGMASHSSIPPWRIPMDRGAWWITVHGVTKSQT